jgi:hypothetical protein
LQFRRQAGLVGDQAEGVQHLVRDQAEHFAIYPYPSLQLIL